MTGQAVSSVTVRRQGTPTTGVSPQATQGFRYRIILHLPVAIRLLCRADLESRSRRSVVGTCHVWVDGAPDKITAAAQGTYAVPLPR